MAAPTIVFSFQLISFGTLQLKLGWHTDLGVLHLEVSDTNLWKGSMPKEGLYALPTRLSNTPSDRGEGGSLACLQ